MCLGPGPGERLFHFPLSCFLIQICAEHLCQSLQRGEKKLLKRHYRGLHWVNSPWEAARAIYSALRKFKGCSSWYHSRIGPRVSRALRGRLRRSGSSRVLHTGRLMGSGRAWGSVHRGLFLRRGEERAWRQGHPQDNDDGQGKSWRPVPGK